MSRITMAMTCLVTPLLALSAVAGANLRFDDIVDNLNTRKYAKQYVREYWQSVQDQQVSWSGEAYDVQSRSKTRAKIYIADRSRPLFNGYNIIVTTHEVEKAAAIKRGEQVKFIGTLRNYVTKRSGAVLEITEAQLL